MSYISWTSPTTGDHPRLWVTSSTLSSMQTRTTGSHIAHFSALEKHCDRLLGVGAYPVSYFDDKDPEEAGVLAFSYLMDSSRTDHMRRAQEIAIHLGNLPFDELRSRKNLQAMAMIYDWGFSYLSLEIRALLRKRIYDIASQIYIADTSEMLWGMSLANSSASLFSLMAILEDGSATDNTTWGGMVNTLFDQFDLGGDPNRTTFLASQRFFAESHGGSYLGSGPFSWFAKAQGIFGRLVPAVLSAVAVDWPADEDWFELWADWSIWLWRGDRTFHRIGEQLSPAPYSADTAIHLLQVAEMGTSTIHKNALWLVNEMQDCCQPMQSQHEIWNILWRDVTLAAERPTIATTGGGAGFKKFGKAGILVMRSDWEELGTSMTIDCPQYFTGGHSQRRGGHFNLCHQGVPVFYDKGTGRLEEEQTETYTNDNGHKGFRYSYAMRILAANIVRIYDSNEPTENPVDSFQHLPGDELSRYGELSGGSVTISNDGGQLVPKNAALTKSQPDNIEDMLDEAKWTTTTTRLNSGSGTGYMKAVLELEPFYYAGKMPAGQYKRYFLWIVPDPDLNVQNPVPDWSFPMIFIYDRITCHTGDPIGIKTRTIQFQASDAGSDQGGGKIRFTDGAARVWVYFTGPITAELNFDTTGDYSALAGVNFDPSAGAAAAYDDPKGRRNEMWDDNDGQHFHYTLVGSVASSSDVPTIVKNSVDTYYGITANGIDIEILKDTPWTVSIAASADGSAPAAPTNVVGTAHAGVVLVEWDDNGEGDLSHYLIERSVAGGGWVELSDEVTASEYRDYDVTLGSTHSYQVRARDFSQNTSGYSTASSNVTPDLGIQGPELIPQPISRELARRARAARTRPRWPMY